MAVQTRISPIEPTATDQSRWNRKAAERINQLLVLVETMQLALADVEAKQIEQDSRLDGIDGLNVEQNGRLAELEGRMSAVEAKNAEQDGRLDALEGPPAP